MFREDLYYRLNVFQVEVPPLRDRKEDIPLLGADFLRRFSKKMDKEVDDFSKEALEIMMQYSWPGNIRELENVVERAVVFCKGDTIVLADLPPKIKMMTKSGVSGNLTLKEMEREMILRALTDCDWNKHQAARILGIDRGTLYGKIKRYGFKK